MPRLLPRLVHRLWRRSFLRGLVVTVAYARSGARVHPTTRLDAGRGRITLGRGAKVSERCVLEADGPAAIALAADVWLAPHCEIHTTTAAGVTIGRGTTVQRRCGIEGSVTIGDGCILAPNVFISSGSHLFDRWPELPIREQEHRALAAGGLPDAPVTIGDDVWLGVNVVVTPGRTIGRGAVVGANAVVTHDVEPYAIVAGVPAKVIGSRLDEATRR